MEVKEMKVAIIGSGVMGSGIAQVCAMAGHKVWLYDILDSALEKAKAGIENNLVKGIARGKVTEDQKEQAMMNISFTSAFEDLKVDLAIEAIVERLDVKVDVFNKLDKLNGGNVILATNTSSIPITQISAKLDRPASLVGIHFFNPAHIMKLVEVISGAHTTGELVDFAFDFVIGLGKTPIKAKDAPGFIVNRVARHFYVESLKIAEENVANFSDIDDLIRSSGFKMGPFQLMDLIGVETNLSVTTSMYELFNYDAKFRPSRIQQQKAAAGHHGRKTGKGFYSYE
jgi:3-hydroxybutyryl-CoA dehydrogenase